MQQSNPNEIHSSFISPDVCDTQSFNSVVGCEFTGAIYNMTPIPWPIQRPSNATRFRAVSRFRAPVVVKPFPTTVDRVTRGKGPINEHFFAPSPTGY